MPVSLVFSMKVFFLSISLQTMSIKRRLTWFDQKQHVYFRCFFVCVACLPVSLIMHVLISEVHAQWHWCLHFSMSLNSQRFLQFHPTVMSVAYFISCFITIRKHVFPVPFLAEWVQILVQPRARLSFGTYVLPKQQTASMRSTGSPMGIWKELILSYR